VRLNFSTVDHPEIRGSTATIVNAYHPYKGDRMILPWHRWRYEVKIDGRDLKFMNLGSTDLKRI
jgi:hypothetical protein